MNTTTTTRQWLRLAVAILSAALLAGCGAKSSANPTTLVPSGAASSAHSAYSSITANPTTHAELDQAKALVSTCFAGTPLQQLNQVHLVFLSSATGKHGPEVVAARAKTFGCLGIPADQRQNFINDALTAAEHGHLLSGGHAARVTYFGTTLPQLVLKYKGASTASPSPAPSAGASS